MFNGWAAHACISVSGVLALDISQCRTLEPIWVDATLNNLTATCGSASEELILVKGFAFDLADFQ